MEEVIKNINSAYRNNSVVNRRCYINTIKSKRIIAFYRSSLYVMKEKEAEYDANTVHEYDFEWINLVLNFYTIETPSPMEKV